MLNVEWELEIKSNCYFSWTVLQSQIAKTEMKIAFQEEQRFTQWWLWLIVIGTACLPIYGIYKQMILGEPFGNKPMPDFVLILFLVFALGLVVFFAIMQLKTEIDQDGIRINYIPFNKNLNIKWSEIEKAEVLNYGFVGGWGIRLGTKYGTVYNTKGNKGLAI